MIKVGSKELTPQGCSKVMKGSSLVWENAKKVSWNARDRIPTYVDNFYIPVDFAREIKGKLLISLKIEGYKDIDGQNIKGVSVSGFLTLTKRLYELLDPQTVIPAGTKMTILYK